MMRKYNLNIRQMQVYAAICLRVFCNHVGIKHDSVNRLIEHLLEILITRNLPDWEQKGTMLAITGRGDPLPVDVEETIAQRHLELFNSLVENCVEVGIVDMYGASTEQPRMFLEKCVNSIQRLGLDMPPLETLRKLNKGETPWGEPIDEAEFKKILNEMSQY